MQSTERKNRNGFYLSYIYTMIVIVSQENDSSTNDVMDWLYAWNKKVVRINETDTINSFSLQIDDNDLSLIFRCGNKEFKISDVDYFWFRRGGFVFDVSFLTKIEPHFYTYLKEHLSDECNTMKDFLVYLLNKKPSLGNYYQGNANKLISLYVAQKVGMEIPNTIISSAKEDLLHFYKNQKSSITKFIQDVLCFNCQGYRYYTNTSLVEKNDIKKMRGTFFPSLLQKEIHKRYELRIFYLKGKCYSMAIFSQEDKQTVIDFRNYNDQIPNRYVPYKLPHNIEDKIDKFMHKMNLDTGSIDMIVTPDLKYIFLEVNPVGQYDMVSVPCNYYLHKKIAQTISNNE